jgi:hypothetical protein
VLVLLECSCGEPLLDNVAKCPKCGKPNLAYRPSRWRIFWPDVDTIPGADEAIRLGYWAAFLVAILGTIVTLLGASARGLAGLVDAALFAICGLGIWRKWRSAAVVAFLLLAANLVLSVPRGGIGVLTIFIFVGLLNALRGTFARVGLLKHSEVEEAG